MPKLVYDVVFNVDDTNTKTVGQNIEKAAKSVDKSKESVEKFGQELKSIPVSGQKASDAVKTFGLTADKSYEMASKSAQQYAKSQKSANKQVGRGNKQFASANQLVFSFSDGIQDAAQFSQGFGTGMRAIGNNISFTAELLGVTARNAKEAGVSMKTALKSAITPVTGAILALNVGLTVGQFLWNDYGGSVKETKENIKAFINESANLKSLGGFDFVDINSIKNQIDAINSIEFAIDGIIDAQEILDTESFRETLSFISTTFGGSVGDLASNTFVAEKNLESLEERFGLTAPEAKFLRDELERLNTELEKARALEKLNPIAKLKRELGADVGESKSLFDAGLIDERQLSKQAGEIQQEIIDLRVAGVSGLEDLLVERGAKRDIVDSLGLGQQDVASAINIFKSQLDGLSDFVPKKPVIDNIIPTSDIIDKSEEIRFSLFSAMTDFQTDGEIFSGIDIEADTRALTNEQIIQDAKDREETLKNVSKDATDARIADARREMFLFNLFNKKKKEFGKQQFMALAQAAGEASRAMFGDTKAGAIASAVVNASSAIVRQFDDLPFPAAVVTSSLVAASTLKQIQRIKNTDFGDSGNTSSSGSSGSSSGIISSSDVERPTQSITFNPRSPQASNQGMTVQVVNTFDKKTAAKVVREGETQIKNSQKKVVTSA